MTEQNESQREKVSHSPQVLPVEVSGASRMRKAQIKPEFKLGVVEWWDTPIIPAFHRLERRGAV